MPELSTESFAEQKALIKDPINQLIHDRHAELLFTAIEHFMKTYQGNHLKEELFSYVENHLAKLGITGFLNPDNPIPSSAISSLKSALVALNQAQLDQLDNALFSQEAFKSISTQKTFIDVLEIWQNKFPSHRRFGRLYSAMPEDQPHAPALSLKHYYQTLLADLMYYHEMKKDDLSSCYEKIQSLCSNLIVLEHLQYLDSYFQAPNLPLNDKIALIQLTHDACLSYFNAPIESSTLSATDTQDLKESFSKLIRLILSQYLHGHQFSIFNSEPAEHLREALITCCIEMQDRTSPKNKHGKTKKRTSTYNGKKHQNFIQCQEAIEATIQTFQQQDLASTGVFFYQGDNTNPDLVLTFIQQHWRHHQHSEHFQTLLHRYWLSFYNSLQPLWESTTPNTDEQFNHALCTHLYNFLLPEIKNIHRIALVLDCIQEASTLPATSEVERDKLREIKDLIQLKIDQRFDLIGSDLNDELLRFFGHTEDPLSLHMKWHTMPPQEIQLESTQSIQAIRTILLDCSGEKRRNLKMGILNQYKDEANKDRADKRAACQGMIDTIESSLPTAIQISELCWRYVIDQNTKGITSSNYFIPNIDPEIIKSAVVPGCFGMHDLSKGQRFFKEGVDLLQPSQGPLWPKTRTLITQPQEEEDSGYEQDDENEIDTEHSNEILGAPTYRPPPPPKNRPITSPLTEKDAAIIEADQKHLLAMNHSIPLPPNGRPPTPPLFEHEIVPAQTNASDNDTMSNHRPPPPPPPKNSQTCQGGDGLSGVTRGFAIETDIIHQDEQPQHVAPSHTSHPQARGGLFAEALRKGKDRLNKPQAEERAQSTSSDNPFNTPSVTELLTQAMRKRRSQVEGDDKEPLLGNTSSSPPSSSR